MKNLVLLFTGLLMTLTTVTAAEKITATQGEDLNISRYSYAQPIQFVERGVEFLIFPDGSFDFNTNLSDTQGSFYYRTRTSRRGPSINSTFGAPGTQVTFTASSVPRGVIVTHDRDGKVRRVGNVFVNYNRYDQVKRLGSVYINYNRLGLVSQVGGLHIRYNSFGEIISTNGHVNYWNQGCGICGANSCNTNHFIEYNTWNASNHFTDTEDFYYYRKDGKVKKQKKIKRK
ncbi:hypothetical protein ACFS5M_08375 [Lacinutrix iliipiscaria]|uniref:Uncharacterized protein n=1 Tax=Lacinutrix iliipiscaria TaxID=1230532 RepID=A0ABW5WN55_9FLAO